MKNFLKALIVVPLTIVIVLFAVANRQIITVHLDPFETGLLPFPTISLPLYLLLFGVGLIGVMAGGSATWLAQGKHRRAARQHAREAQSHRTELDRIKAREEAQRGAGGTPALPPPSTVR